MVSRQNIDGRPRPSGVLPTVQAGPAAGLADPTATPIPSVSGPRPSGTASRRGTGRRGRGGRRRDGIIPDLNGEEEHFPPPGTPPPAPPPTDGDLPPYPPGKGPQPQVPPTAPRRVPGGSRRGGGAGYRARTGQIARETTEAQEQAGRGGRFGKRHVDRYGRTLPPGMVGGANIPQGRRYPTGSGQGPRWATSEGGGGYGTIPPPLPPPPPPPEPEPPVVEEERPPRDRDGRGGRRRGRARRGRLR